MTVYKNDILYNAAIAGVTAGVNDGKDFSQVSTAQQASSAAIAEQAAIVAICTEIDSLIPFDATLSVSSSNGTLLVTPNFGGSGTAAQIMPVFSKYNALTVICQAAFREKGDITAVLNADVPGTWVAIAAGIAAQYATTAAALVVAG
jgi:hypothetical protein